MPVKPGDILQDRLRIDALIGRGGMGQVFAATDLDSRQHVAVKVVSRLFVDETLMLRLHREAIAAQRIKSDYVPKVIEVGDTGDGETYLVMERLMGEPLSARIRSQGALEWSEVARLGEEILRGLIDAHAAGIIHRDLKPSNIFLALKTGRVRAMVLDFGVCKMDGVDTERLTGTGESIGTVAYMAPEQIRGAAKVDERADIYAFGVLVFEMLAGRLPHEGPSQMAILASKLEKESARLRECVRYPIPEQLDTMIMRSLSRDPKGRQGSATELLREWRVLARAEGFVSGPTLPPGALPSTPLPPPSVHDDDPPTEISKPNVMTPELRLLGTTSDDEHLPETNHGAAFAAMFPPEKHPTEIPLTAPSDPNAGFEGPNPPPTPAKIAMMGGLAAALIVLCVFAFAFSRPDPPVRRTTAIAAPPPVPTDTAEPEPQVLPLPEPAASEEMELPPDRAPASSPRPRPVSVSRPRVPAPAPKPKTPGITSQPRY